MNLLNEIIDEFYPTDKSTIEEREASRAILLDENNLVPILFVSKQNYHKLPGGGVDPGENYIEALHRECLEEVGCKIDVLGEVGVVVECRSKEKFNWFNDLHQVSYCYYGKITKKGNPNFTQDELDDCFQIQWLPLDDAIKIFKTDKPNNIEGSYILRRDLTFLMEYKKGLNLG